MKVIVVSDIWGRTEALSVLYLRTFKDYIILDPYSGSEKNFESEGDAYKYFINECGMEKYYAFVSSYIQEQHYSCNLLGFSVGATVAWLLACRITAGTINKTACFYGSRVRDFLNERPKQRGVDFFLAVREPSFNVLDFSRQLSAMPMVTLHKTRFSHGFMNSCSENFNPEAYRHYRDWLKIWANGA
ncbi:hypothetical protein ACJJID_16315 [Microbulbifer sp. CnH-101-G]|uniref:hypothetical protein n=1 Tax=Microbulbifer sp. CnH-101-G TaxID=3243393 RepID=UPI0040397AD6